MAIEIVDFPNNGDFPLQNVSSPEGKSHNLIWTPALMAQHGGFLTDAYVKPVTADQTQAKSYDLMELMPAQYSTNGCKGEFGTLLTRSNVVDGTYIYIYIYIELVHGVYNLSTYINIPTIIISQFYHHCFFVSWVSPSHHFGSASFISSPHMFPIVFP